MPHPEPRKARSEVKTAPARSWSRSRSGQRRPSLPRVKSSQRLIRTISIEGRSDDGRTEDGDDGLLRLAFGSGTQQYIEVPYVKATLDASLPEEYLRQDVVNMTWNLRVPKWYRPGTRVAPEEVKLLMITGTMTNAIFKVEHPRLPSLLLRVYGPNVESIIDRDYELQTLARLSRQNIGPSLYGCFMNGRFEQFLENATTLTKKDIRDWKTSQRIARRMKEFHCGVPLLDWEKTHYTVLARIDKWLKKMGESSWIQKQGNMQSALFVQAWPQFLALVERYRAWLKSVGELDQPLVFCHNDAQYGNLLFAAPVVASDSSSVGTSTSTPVSGSLFPSESNISVDEIIRPSIHDQAQDSKLVVIDFEYAGPNPAAYDLANHLSEWMADYHCAESYKTFEHNFPKKEEILNFIYSYTSHLSVSKQDPIDDKVRELYNSILRWRPCVSLHWALWGLVQSGELDEPKDLAVAVEEDGPGGEKYIITVDDCESINSIDSCLTSSSSVEEPPTAKGADIHSFDYVSYTIEKMCLFYGDLLQLGIITKDDLLPEMQPKLLDSTFL
ncbi:AaceriAGL199Cp [[Ashbya] aceris (nom. inval.)]|nr:AaceriAGL199Cp [[Ashbya] aceris (nom. inval.)]